MKILFVCVRAASADADDRTPTLIGMTGDESGERQARARTTLFIDVRRLLTQLVFAC